MNKALSIIIACFLSAIIFFACSKELSYETSATPAGNSGAGTLKDSSGNCLPIVVKGTYYNGVIPGDTNIVQLTINVKTVGSYNILTPLQNGFQFAGGGVFSSTGIQTINLRASGTPEAHVPTDFTVTYDTTTCGFTVDVIDSAGRSSGGIGVAVFALSGAPNACTNAVVSGNYFANTNLTGTNTVVIPVNVATIGTYSLATTTVNGYKFSAAGTFTSTGPQNITLVGSGVPTNAGTDIFKPAIGNSSCTFTVNVTAAPQAVFTLAGAPGACTNFVVNGVFNMGTALNSANTVIVNVNVTTAGSYTLSTNTVNGMTFSASGMFANTGAQTVTLLGNGNPTDSGNSTLTLTAGASSCSFIVPVVVSTSPCTSLTPNQFTLSSPTGTVYYNVPGPAIPIVINNYELQVTSSSTVANLIIDFQGTSQPAAGVYSIGAGVSIKSVDPGFVTNGITWNADNGGKVYVTNDANTGGIILQFCNLSFTGTSIISSTIYAGVGQAQEQSN